MADKSDASTYSAGYGNYPNQFSNNYFSADLNPKTDAPLVVETVQRLIKRGFTRDNLRWGYYQKFAPPDPSDPNNWGSQSYYDNWEASIDEAREALAKTPVDPKLPGPDPDNPKMVSKNMLEHLDAAVKIALFDKHLFGNPDDPGVEIRVRVGKQSKRSRRHKVLTEWRQAKNNHGDPKYKYDRLTITMTCPTGGWVGTAVWKYSGTANFTRYEATFKVPPPPATVKDQIIFIFNGLESLPTPNQPLPPAILQPVLQWTKAGKWEIRSWYVPATYTPTLEQMPGSQANPFTSPLAPAWSGTTSVKKGDVLRGVIEWDNMNYKSSFWVTRGKSKPVQEAVLETPNILPLVYPVAVIEAYAYSDADELVETVEMTRILLKRSDVPDDQLVEPTWTVGKDAPPAAPNGQPSLGGTGALQLYDVDASAANGTVTFAIKDPPPIFNLEKK